MLPVAVAIERSRELLGSELSALVGESYERAYGDMVRVQQLTELEEVIRYQQTFTGMSSSLADPCCSLLLWMVFFVSFVLRMSDSIM